jgi:hypothetical protein
MRDVIVLKIPYTGRTATWINSATLTERGEQIERMSASDAGLVAADHARRTSAFGESLQVDIEFVYDDLEKVVQEFRRIGRLLEIPTGATLYYFAYDFETKNEDYELLIEWLKDVPF